MPLSNPILNSSVSNNNGIALYFELLKLIGNSFPNNISNVNNNYLNFNNFYQNNNNFNIINGLNNLSGMGNLLNFVNSGQNSFNSTLNPKAPGISNDLSFLNSVLLENNNNKTLSKILKEMEDLNNNKLQNNTDSSNGQINNEHLLNVNSTAHFSKGEEFANNNESLILKLLTGVNNNENLLSNLNNYSNQFQQGVHPQSYLNSLLNAQNPSLISANPVLNYLNNNNNISLTNLNHPLNAIKKITNEEKTIGLEDKNSNYHSKNIQIENQISNNLNQNHIRSLIDQNPKLDDIHTLKANGEEAPKMPDRGEKITKRSIGDLGFKIDNDLTNLKFDAKQHQMISANQDFEANLKQIDSLQNLQSISQIFSLVNSNEAKSNKENKEQIFSVNCNINNNVENIASTNKSENKEPRDDSNASADRAREKSEKSKTPNIIQKGELNGKKIEDLNQEILLNIINTQQTSTSLEPVNHKENENLDKKDSEKENQNENLRDGIRPSSRNESLTNQIDFSENEPLINPLLLKFNENLTNQINNIPLHPNLIQDFSQNNQNKAFHGLINLNQIINTNPHQNINSDLILNQGNLLNLQNILINNNLHLSQFQGQLSNLNNINNSAESNEHNLDNIYNRNLNVNRPNDDMNNLNTFLQEYLKNCAEPN